MSTKVTVFKTIDKGNLAGQREIRGFSQATERLRRVPFDKITIRKGFNLRETFAELEELAESIDHIGLQKPLAVDILDDGAVVLTDGERRYRAIDMMRGTSAAMKAKYEFVDAIINDKKFTEAQRVAAMLIHNSGVPLEPQEEAEGYRRLRDEHFLDLKSIAATVGRSVPYVETRLLLADADPEEKENIRTKKITPTAQVQLMRQEKDPVKRKAVVKAATANGKKVKVKDVKSVPVGKKCDEVLALIVKANKERISGVLQNLLYEIDSKVREIKRDVK